MSDYGPERPTVRPTGTKSMVVAAVATLRSRHTAPWDRDAVLDAALDALQLNGVPPYSDNVGALASLISDALKQAIEKEATDIKHQELAEAYEIRTLKNQILNAQRQEGLI